MFDPIQPDWGEGEEVVRRDERTNRSKDRTPDRQTDGQTGMDGWMDGYKNKLFCCSVLVNTMDTQQLERLKFK